MSGIILEPIEDEDNVPQSEAPAESTASVPAEPIEGLASIEESVAQPIAPEPVEEVPVKRPRGRPKGKAKAKEPKPRPVPKAPVLKRETTTRRKPQPEEYSDSSTSEEEMVGRLMEDDMETQILQFLSARKRDQESKRRNLWQNLASSGLRR